jgi:uncharacterized membrane protein YkvA (DUF1232 family)
MGLGKKLGKFNRAFLIFRALTKDAEQYHDDPRRAEELARGAYQRAHEHRKGPLARVWHELMAFLRLIKAWASGDYRKAPWKSMVLVIAAVLYFVSPIDAIPDWIPIVGFADDAVVIAFVMRAIRKDVRAFLEWESTAAAS